MTQGSVDYCATGGIAQLTLRQPDKLNAMSFDMWSSLPALVEQAAADDSVRVIVIEGQGPRAFCSGADISQFSEKRSGADDAQAYERSVSAGLAAVSMSSKPTLARVRGVCFGGGLALALACDVRLASEDARFCIPAAKLGLGYAYPNVAFITRRIGLAAAADILYSARAFDAREAQRIGVATHIWGVGTFDAESAAYIARLACNAPLTLKAIALSLRELQKDEAARDASEADRAVAACFASEDYLEGRRAFAQKRTPIFKGQ